MHDLKSMFHGLCVLTILCPLPFLNSPSQSPFSPSFFIFLSHPTPHNKLQTLKHLSEFSHEIPSLKTSATEQDQRPKDSRPWEYQLSPKIAARMSFWLEAISSSDDNLKTILKEKMELKEEVMCLMDEVEVLKV